jgi:hypothetical protein
MCMQIQAAACAAQARLQSGLLEQVATFRDRLVQVSILALVMEAGYSEVFTAQISTESKALVCNNTAQQALLQPVGPEPPTRRAMPSIRIARPHN